MSFQAHILIVDDNRSLVRIMEHLLQKEGFRVLTAFDGAEGLAKARQERPDLIILDIAMPKLNGYEVCRLLQSDSHTAAIPVLMLTVKGQLDPATEERDLDTRIKEQMDGFEAGATDFLSKPVKAKDLLDRVKTLLWFEGFPGFEDVEINHKDSEKLRLR
jgi:DNA-binding response OmpR family regulator